MANNAIIVSDIGFDGLRDSLKGFLSSQSEFTDYDFDSSTMSVLIDLLAYNTYHNSFYLNMGLSESFLDSAQLRNNVVSRAKMLNYTPRSARGASATLNVVVTPDDTPSSVVIPANTAWTSTIDSVNYTFVTTEAHALSKLSNDTWSSNTVTITEGDTYTHRFTVSTTNPVRYVIPNQKVDTSSISVLVQDSTSNTALSTYTEASNLSTVTGSSKVFFLQENEDSEYELLFGDNVIGRRLSDGNIVITKYRQCNGSLTNGANTFSSPGTIAGYSTFSVTTATPANGGDEQESVSSIRQNAPQSFSAQNRAITENDYAVLVKNNFGDIQSVSVWGGQENNPPVYGKVYVSVKPTSGTLISTDRKNAIQDFLNARSSLAIDAVIQDAVYLYVIPSISVWYDPNLTNTPAGTLATKIASQLIEFERSRLGEFGNDFYHSQLVTSISSLDNAFISTQVGVGMEKRFLPSTNTSTTYTIKYFNGISEPSSSGHITHDGPHAVSSSKFSYEGTSLAQFDDDGEGVLRVYRSLENSFTYLNRSIGTIDYENGIITINSFNAESYAGDYLSVTATPSSKDIVGLRDQILLIGGSEIKVYNNNTKALESRISSVGTSGLSTVTNESGINSIVI